MPSDPVDRSAGLGALLLQRTEALLDLPHRRHRLAVLSQHLADNGLHGDAEQGPLELVQLRGSTGNLANGSVQSGQHAIRTVAPASPSEYLNDRALRQLTAKTLNISRSIQGDFS